MLNMHRKTILRFMLALPTACAIRIGMAFGALAQISAVDRKYGARGDGDSDDTESLQMAINDAVAIGGILKIPKTEKYYRTTRSLVVPKGGRLNIVLEGVIKLSLPIGAEAANVLYGKDVKSFSISGGGIIDGGYEAGKLEKGRGGKSTMAGVFIVNLGLDGEEARVDNITFRNTFTAACSLVGFKRVELLGYSAEYCGVSHQNTPYAGESVVVADAENVLIDGFHALRCMDGAGFLRCVNVVARNMNFNECGLGPDVPSCKQVEIDGLNVISPLIYGFTSIAWGAEGIRQGARHVVLKRLKIIGKPINLDGREYLGKGVGVDSTEYISIDGDIDGVSVGLTVSKNFLNQKFRPSRNGVVIFNGNILNCMQSAVVIESVDQIRIVGLLRGNGRANKSRFPEISVVANDVDSKVGDIYVSMDSLRDDDFLEGHLLLDSVGSQRVGSIEFGGALRPKVSRFLGGNVKVIHEK